MKLSLRNRILKYYESRKDIWISGGEIEDLSREAGYKGSNSGRRLRELHEAGYLDRKIEKGHVWYKFREIEISSVLREVREKAVSIPVQPRLI